MESWRGRGRRAGRDGGRVNVAGGSGRVRDDGLGDAGVTADAGVGRPEQARVSMPDRRESTAEYSRVPEKKGLLLHALSEHKDPSILPAVVPFLEDMNDEVQIAASEVMAKQQDPAGREPLIQHFLKAHEGSNARVREALAGVLADSGFDVKGYTPKVEAALPPAYKLDSKGKVVRK